jgi:hypothetical protein
LGAPIGATTGSEASTGIADITLTVAGAELRPVATSTPVQEKAP